MRKILIATGIFPPDIGGPATYTKTLFEELPKLGWEVKVVTYSDQKLEITRLPARQGNQNSELKDNKSEIFRISRKNNKLIRYFLYFWRMWRLIPWADVVYAQGPVSEGCPTYWACKLRRKPYTLKVVGDYAWEQYQVKSKKLKVKSDKKFIGVDEFQVEKFDFKIELTRRIEKLVARRAVKIIVPSNYLKKIVQQWGAVSGKIQVIYNCVAVEAGAAKEKKPSERWLVSAGRLVPWKGMDTLIDIMPSLLAIEPNLKLIIIGDGPEQEKLKIKTQKLKVNDAVLILGKLTHAETLAYLRAADCFILNSGYEGLSNLIIEALACGTQVLASNIGGNPEIVILGKTGVLFEYNNKDEIKEAIIKFLTISSQDKNLMRREQEIYFKQHFSLEAMIKSVASVLEEV